MRTRLDRRTVVLAGILVVAALLYCWGLGDRVAQPYYAAAVRSMSHSWTAFLFSGYDPAGVVTIDKPPLAFWVQAAGVWVFGFHWWSLALVQAVEGVAAVFVLHRVVRRWAGDTTALVAAGLLALSPITAAINRDDVPDTLLVLLLVLAAYCVTRAVEDGRTGWLVAAAAFAGLGFLAKMLMAWAVLPALALAYLPAPVSRLRKTGQLALAGLVTLAVSLWWPVLVSLWPGGKPYVGSTSDGSIWQLILGYNGFGRLVGDNGGSLSAFGAAVGTDLGGAPGPLRLLNPVVGGQIGWFLPLALVTLVVAAFRYRQGTAVQRAGWLLWGGWFVVYALVFSFTGGIFHAYYTATLAPAVAVLAAAGLVFCWRHNRYALVAAIVGTALLSFFLLSRTPDWLPWLGFAVLVLAVVAVAGVLPNRRPTAAVSPNQLPTAAVSPNQRPTATVSPNRRPTATVSPNQRPTATVSPNRRQTATVSPNRPPTAAVSPNRPPTAAVSPNRRPTAAVLPNRRPMAYAGLVAIVLGPLAYSVATAGARQDVLSAADPLAGPSTTDGTATARTFLGTDTAAIAYARFMDSAAAMTAGQRETLDYATSHAGTAPIQLAVEGGSYGADPFLVDTDARVVALGGYLGLDPAPTVPQLVDWVHTGRVRYILLPAVFRELAGTGGSNREQSAESAITSRIEWLVRSCTPVPTSAIGPHATTTGALFDCH